MSDKTLLYYGALLHDVGKVVQRESNSFESHAALGASLITNEVAVANNCFAGDDGRRIVEQVRLHNAQTLREAGEIPDNSLAYITYFANSVAKGEDSETRAEGAGHAVKLHKIFNSINGHHDAGVVEHDDYAAISKSLTSGLSRIGVSASEVNDLLNLLESTIREIPSSTDEEGLIDVSLYDHVKTTAGISACVYEFLKERGIFNYRKTLLDWEEPQDPYSSEMFLLYSCDMSGIQDFIYNISGSGALKQLRARSMYLELLIEYIVDELLERLGLNRSNLLYTGGGHAYLLLPNTEKAKKVITIFDDELEAWLVDNYRNDLYIASAWVECSADDLSNRGSDKKRYPMLYQRLSRKLSEAKAKRYDAETIRRLNFGETEVFDHSRECSECRRSDLHLDKDNKCTLCAGLGMISKSLVNKDVFVVDATEDKEQSRTIRRGLVLPFGCELRMYSLEEYRSRQIDGRRIYIKNNPDVLDAQTTHIWMGDYTAETPQDVGLSAFATQSATLDEGKGIKRLGVLRADVDDLGATFVSGLPNDKMSIARTPALSRSLSYFFKSKINDILRLSGYQVQIIYSGGDDLFIVGNWSDVLYAAIEIRKALDVYTGNGSLTLSAGIGMFDDTYPIARMASETGQLEDSAKAYVNKRTSKTKDAVALWSVDSVFNWEEFVCVIEPRKNEIRDMFAKNQKGSAFIYRLISLLRSYDVVASAPRLAYLLARSFERDKKHGDEASRQIYAWAQDPIERRRLIAAMEWYVYSIRKESEL